MRIGVPRRPARRRACGGPKKMNTQWPQEKMNLRGARGALHKEASGRARAIAAQASASRLPCHSIGGRRLVHHRRRHPRQAHHRKHIQTTSRRRHPRQAHHRKHIQATSRRRHPRQAYHRLRPKKGPHHCRRHQPLETALDNYSQSLDRTCTGSVGGCGNRVCRHPVSGGKICGGTTSAEVGISTVPGTSPGRGMTGVRRPWTVPRCRSKQSPMRVRVARALREGLRRFDSLVAFCTG